MNKVLSKISVGYALLFILWLAMPGCSTYHKLTAPTGRGMERLAEDRYAQAQRYMKASRYELAQQQFAIVERTTQSAELRQLAHDGYTQAVGAIEAKR